MTARRIGQGYRVRPAHSVGGGERIDGTASGDKRFSAWSLRRY